MWPALFKLIITVSRWIEFAVPAAGAMGGGDSGKGKDVIGRVLETESEQEYRRTWPLMRGAASTSWNG